MTVVAPGGCHLIPGRSDGVVLQVSAGSCLRRLVEGPRRQMTALGGVAGGYAVLRPSRGIDHVVCLERPEGPQLPISLTTAREMIADALDHPHGISIGQGGIQTQHWRSTVQSWRHDRVGPMAGPPDPDALARLQEQLASFPTPREPAAVHRRISDFLEALHDLSDARLLRAAASLVGLGLGSTPSGDDVLAAATATLGAAAALPATARAAKRLQILRTVILRSRTRTSPVSAALLYCAARGHAIRPMRRLISATTGADDAGDAGRGLLAVGHSSGYFLALGVHSAATAVLCEAAEG